jgi:WD40 repeat protein
MRSPGFLTALCVIAAPAVGVAQQADPKSPLPPADQTPQLVINHAGPHAPIQSLAFAPDGTLYAGGYGKLVHKYALKDGQYQLAEPIRVPIGPGNAGAVNAVAVSADGKWVAVAGRAPLRGEVRSGSNDGVVVKTQFFPTLLKQDYGVVYLFDPAKPLAGKVIRGPEAGVRSMAFANPAPADGPVLVTTSVEWDADGKSFGAVRVYDGTSGKELAVRKDLPATATRPGVAAWMVGKTVHVAVAWPAGNDPGKLLVWDATANKEQRFDDGRLNIVLAAKAGKGGAEQIVSGGFAQAGGQLVFRSAQSPADGQAVPLGGAGQFYLPLAAAVAGDSTAVAVRVLPPQGVQQAAKTELWLLDVSRRVIGRVALSGEDLTSPPPLAASPDGKWLAVGGFADNRIEVYDVASITAGRPTMQVLAGAPGGFARTAFLAGDRLWLGGPTDTAARGGVVFDPVAKKVTGGDGAQIDGPPGGGSVAWIESSADDVVTLAVAAAPQVRFTLLKGEKPTAVAFLPAAPTWDKQLKAVLAVAHHDPKAAVSLVTLFDATDGRRLMQLSGPALRVEGLAFAGSRPLLAAVGADRVVSVWSLRNLRTPLAAVEGVTLYERGGELVVAAVEPTSPARDVLKPEAVIEAVGGEKGEPKAVKSYHEFLLAVREVGVGNTARVRLKGAAAAVAVPVGRGIGRRLPLFDLWVNPVANKDGTHDWIGWSAAGPYDANSLTAEARLGWLNATGNPAEPVRYAGADQYRRQYHKTDLIRLLMEEADFDAALRRHSTLFPRTKPTLIVRAEGTEERDGRVVVRARPADLSVTLNDPAQAVLLDQAVLRWRAVDRDGKPGEWQSKPLTALRTMIPVADAGWGRGSRRYEVEVRETPTEPPAVEASTALVLVPPAPVVTLKVNGAKVADGQKLTSEPEAVEVLAEALPGAMWAAGEGVTVTLNSSGPDGKDSIVIPVGKAVSVKLRREAQTSIRVTAVNTAATDDKALESSGVGVTVWHTPKPPKPAPQVRLSLTSPADPPLAPGEPFVTDTPTVRLSAAVVADNITKLEWDDGDGKWMEAAYKPADPKAPAVTREVTIADGGKPRTLRVRVTADDGATKTDETTVLWAGLPTADIPNPPGSVWAAAAVVQGTVRTVKGQAPYELQVIVESAGGSRRAVSVTPNRADVWQANVPLSPGDNRLSLEVSNTWRRTRTSAWDVRFVRPPAVVAVQPVTAGPDGRGDVVAVVASPAELPPSRLMLADRSITTNPVPVSFGGLTVWWVRAEAVQLETAAGLPAKVRVVAANSDGDSRPVEAAVARKAVPPPPPPRILLTSGPDRKPVASGDNVRTDQPRIAVGVAVKSAVKLTRVEVRRADAADGSSSRPITLDVGADGFTADANPTLPLREGVNQFEVAAVAGEARAAYPFSVSFTPPPVRVVIDGLEETGEGGAATPLAAAGEGKPYQAAGGFVLVRGRVIWAGTGEAANSAGHEVVLVANEVRHLPVELAAPAGGSREARFVAPLFLNAADTQVRAEVRNRGRADGLAQQKVADAAVVVRSTKPITQQRLHVLVIAPLVSDTERAALAREVIAAVGGELPADQPIFHRMPFKHKAFVRTTLYSPLVHNVSKPGVVGLLQDVEDEIRKLADGAGAKGWVNDVVLVYYQGRDQVGKDGLVRLHTTQSITYLGQAGARFALRMDELPATPGVRLQLLNVTEPEGQAQAADPLSTVPLLLRYAWKDREAAGDLLPLFREASARKPTVGEVVDWVSGQVEKKADRAFRPTITLPAAVRDRRLGDGGS